MHFQHRSHRSHRSFEWLGGRKKNFVSEFNKEEAQQSWKNLIHPEVTARYEELIKQCVQEVKKQPQLPPLQDNTSDIRSLIWQKSLLEKLPDSTFEDTKIATYENKISVLEHQNTNLKEELYYLREAMMLIYERKGGDG